MSNFFLCFKSFKEVKVEKININTLQSMLLSGASLDCFFADGSLHNLDNYWENALFQLCSLIWIVLKFNC